MIIRFQCFACNKKLKGDDSAIGKKIRCSGCGLIMRVPGNRDADTEPHSSEEAAPFLQASRRPPLGIAADDAPPLWPQAPGARARVGTRGHRPPIDEPHATAAYWFGSFALLVLSAIIAGIATFRMDDAESTRFERMAEERIPHVEIPHDLPFDEMIRLEEQQRRRNEKLWEERDNRMREGLRQREERIADSVRFWTLIRTVFAFVAFGALLADMVLFGLYLGTLRYESSYRWYVAHVAVLTISLSWIGCAAILGNTFKLDRTKWLRDLIACVGVAAIVATFRSILGLALSFMTLFYKLWKTVQDGHARTTPGKALGFLFIPFFNFYWAFVVIPGLADELNRRAESRSLRVEPAQREWLFAYCIVCMVGLIPFVGLFTPMVAFWIAVAGFHSAVRVAKALDHSP